MSAASDQLQPLVRRMHHQDIQAVSRIESQSYDFPWSIGIFRDCILAGYVCLVVEQEGELRGYAILSVAAGEAHVLNICIAPAFRRRGYALSLLLRLISEARRQRVKTMFLEVRPSNLAATNLYKSIGFSSVGLRRDYYKAAGGTREDALVLSLAL
ncbi:MAG: ribosomal protein S18-alanine N-acetyltransferase [Pseudomonadota bacterium]